MELHLSNSHLQLNTEEYYRPADSARAHVMPEQIHLFLHSLFITGGFSGWSNHCEFDSSWCGIKRQRFFNQKRNWLDNATVNLISRLLSTMISIYTLLKKITDRIFCAAHLRDPWAPPWSTWQKSLGRFSKYRALEQFFAQNLDNPVVVPISLLRLAKKSPATRKATGKSKSGTVVLSLKNTCVLDIENTFTLFIVPIRGRALDGLLYFPCVENTLREKWPEMNCFQLGSTFNLSTGSHCWSVYSV